MSNLTNEILIEQAYELADELTGHPSGADKRIYELIDKNDLDNLREFITKISRELAQEHFHNNDILGSYDYER
jgi:phage terminase Nu1 subunit (DNA packaging protein)